MGAHIHIRPSGAPRPQPGRRPQRRTAQANERSGPRATETVETSPGNFQAWLNDGVSSHCALKHPGSQELRLSAASGWPPGRAPNWRDFGRLAGFTNQKPDGDSPRAADLCATASEQGRRVKAAAEFLEQAIALR